MLSQNVLSNNTANISTKAFFVPTTPTASLSHIQYSVSQSVRRKSGSVSCAFWKINMLANQASPGFVRSLACSFLSLHCYKITGQTISICSSFRLYVVVAMLLYMFFTYSFFAHGFLAPTKKTAQLTDKFGGTQLSILLLGVPGA